MATYDKGILGPVFGKVGLVVGARWNGIDVLRSYNGRNTSRTGAQLAQRARFVEAVELAEVLLPLAELGLSRHVRKTTAMARLVREVQKHWLPSAGKYVLGTVAFSRGKATGARPQATRTSSGPEETVIVQWNSTPGNASDTALVSVFTDSGVLAVSHEAVRSDGTVSISLPSGWNKGIVSLAFYDGTRKLGSRVQSVGV